MAIIGANSRKRLPWIRRLEAAGFRAWPAASVRYDGALVTRLNAGHPAKRLNSLNALDPRDNKDIERRMGAVRQAFHAYGRPVVVRATPLMPTEMIDHCRHLGWTEFDHSEVHKAPLNKALFEDVVDRVPVQDVGLFAQTAISIGAAQPEQKAGLAEIIHSIEPEVGLFALYEGREAVACGIAVRDGDIVGLFEIATHRDHQRKGYGKALMGSALKWAANKGAKTAWLQVVADNAAALQLYERFGFKKVYDYSYWMDTQKAKL